MLTYKSFIGGSDLSFWDGISRTFIRSTSTGGSLSLNKIGEVVNILEVYGSGTAYTDATLRSAISQIASNSAYLLLSPGTWTISNNTTIPANLPLVLPAGATISVDSGKTLTINSNVIDAGNYQIFSGSGSLTFADGLRLRSSWFADFATAISKISTAKVELEITEAESINSTTVNANTTLIWPCAGRTITINSGQTLTINGHVQAGGWQIFAGSGTVSLGTYSSPVIFPEWWGVIADNSTDNATPLQKALTAANSSNIPLWLPYGTCLTSAGHTIVRPNNDTIGIKVYGHGRGRSVIKYTGAAAIGTLLDIDGTSSGYALNNEFCGFKLDVTNAPAGTIGLKINAGVWRSKFEDLYITRDVPGGGRTGTGIYMGSATAADVGCYDNKFSLLYVNSFSKNLHFQGTGLSDNTITNTAIDHSYITDGNYNLYAEYFNGLSANNTQLESAQTAGAYFVWGETAVFIGGSIESAVAGAKGIDMDANTRSVIALCDFFNNAGGHFTANGQIGHLYKSSNSGFVYVAGSEIRMDKDASYTSYLRFFKNGVADARLQTGSVDNTIGLYNSAGTEHLRLDATNAIIDLITSTGVLRLRDGAQINFYQGGVSTKWLVGAGTPEASVTAPVGSLYTRTNGGANTTLYIKESGAGNTGWVAK